MSKKIDTDKLSDMIKMKRGDRGLRDVSKEIGVSAPTLSRIEQGKIPDVETFIRLCEWLGVSAETFTKSGESLKNNGKMALVGHLRAEKELDSETVNMLIKMIDLAYSKKIPKK
jgi:transcriptional regulator with XRE-family HTH domain